ncbi:MAG: heavy metal translocating P-type ATPase [Pseudomonadota bacterium]
MQVAEQVCFHCGEVLPDGHRWPVTVKGAERRTCCPGCQAACRTIVELGLDNYYLHRDSFSARLDTAPVPEDLFVGFGDAALADGGYVRAGETAGSRECTLMIDGLRCAACGWLIEKSLLSLAGVQAASVNLTTGRVRVRWHSGALELRDLLLRIRRLGYRALPFRGDGALSAFDRERRQSLLRLVVAAFGMMQVMHVAVGFYGDTGDSMGTAQRDYLRAISFIVTTPVVFYSGWPFLRNAWFSLRGGMAGMDVPVALAILLAYFASLWAIIVGGPEVWFDSVVMFVFFLAVGRHLELEARRRANRVVDNLSAALPLTATRLAGDREDVVPAAQLRAGDIVRVKAGETIPADGIVLDGTAHVDESMLTGEPLPVRRSAGDRVTGGCISTDAVLRLEITAANREGRLSRIVDLVTRAQESRPAIQQLADRIARQFVVALLLLTVATWLAWQWIDPSRAFWVALAVLVVSCPCALSLATPTACTVATNALTRRGLLITRGNALSLLPDVRAVVFDKTGTLTEGRPVVRDILTFDGVDRDAALRLAAQLERDSEHPLARAFHRADVRATAAELRIVPGCGVEGTIDGTRYRIGSGNWLQQQGLPLPETGEEQGLPQVWLAGPDRILAAFRLGDTARADAASTVADLQARGIEVHLLSGDESGAAARLAAALGIARWCGGATPERKVEYIRQLRARIAAPVLMVGDGINDAPVLAAADVSLAIGDGTDLARTAADGVLLGSRLALVRSALDVAGATRRTVRQNLGWALGYNLSMIPLAVAGWMPPWVAALGMAGSSLVVVLNALAVERRAGENPAP